MRVFGSDKIVSFFREKVVPGDSFRAAAAELERRIGQNGEETRTQLRKLGEYLSYQDADPVSGSEMQGQHRRVQELREKLPASRQQVRRIIQCVERNAELEGKLRSLQGEIRGAEQRNEGLRENIARAALAAWRLELPDRPDLEGTLGALLRQEAELLTLEEELEKLHKPAAETGLFHAVRGFGRSVHLRGALGSRRSAFRRDCRNAGRRIAELGPESMPNGGSDLQRFLEPYRENERNIRALREEIDLLRADQAGIWEELKQLGAARSHQRRVRQLEDEIRRVEEELTAACERLGALYRSVPAGKRPEDEEAARYLERIAALEESSARHRKQIERLEAAIRLEALDRQSRRMEDRIGRLEKEIRVRQEEINLLRARLSETAAEREHLSRIRGTESTLLRLAPPEERS